MRQVHAGVPQAMLPRRLPRTYNTLLSHQPLHLQTSPTRVAMPAPPRTCVLIAATAPPPTQTFSGTTKMAGLQLHITSKHDDKKNKATFEECFGADCTAKA